MVDREKERELKRRSKADLVRTVMSQDEEMTALYRRVDGYEARLRDYEESRANEEQLYRRIDSLEAEIRKYEQEGTKAKSLQEKTDALESKLREYEEQRNKDMKMYPHVEALENKVREYEAQLDAAREIVGQIEDMEKRLREYEAQGNREAKLSRQVEDLQTRLRESDRQAERAKELSRQVAEIQTKLKESETKANKADEMVRQMEALESKLSASEAELEKEKKRQSDILEAGSLAEAALRITDVFEEAQKSADVYLKSIRDMEEQCRRDIAAKNQEVQVRIDEMLADAKNEAVSIRHDAEMEATRREREADKYYENVKERTRSALMNLSRFNEDYERLKKIAGQKPDETVLVVMDEELEATDGASEESGTDDQMNQTEAAANKSEDLKTSR